MRSRAQLAIRSLERCTPEERAHVLKVHGAFTHDELTDVLAAYADVADACDEARQSLGTDLAADALLRADAAVVVARDRLSGLWQRVRKARKEART